MGMSSNLINLVFMEESPEQKNICRLGPDLESKDDPKHWKKGTTKFHKIPFPRSY